MSYLSMCLNKPSSDPECDDLKQKLRSMIIIEQPDTKWKNVVGLQAAKQAMRETLLTPQLFPGTGQADNSWSGILFFGPSCVGKTLLVKAVAAESDVTFINVKIDTILSKWHGETEKSIAAVFQIAAENSPCTIFIDEVDALCSNRSDEDSDGARRLKNALLTEMDGVSKSKQQRVVVVGNTNIPHSLDSAFLRRFPKRVHVGLPSETERKKLIEQALRKYEHKLSSDHIQKLTTIIDRYSGCDLFSLVTEAGFIQLKKKMAKICDPIKVNEKQKDGMDLKLSPVSWSDVKTELRNVKATNDRCTVAKLQSFNESFGGQKKEMTKS